MRATKPLLVAAVVASAFWTAGPASAASCAELLSKGGKVVDTYVMDFGPSDKLYVYIVRTRGGATEKCTSERPLRKQGR